MIRRILLSFSALLLLLSAAIWGGNGIQAGPYLQNATSTSLWVCWETANGASLESRVDYGTTPALGSSATGSYLVSSAGTAIHHTQLTGLTPNTTYHYRVVTGSWSSAVYHFRTPPSLTAETRWRFAALSDTQVDGANSNKHREVIEDGVIDFVQKNFGTDVPSQLAFLINAGDLVSTGSNHSQWQNHFFAQAEQLLREVPLYPVLGNHEANASLYFEYMNLPLNGTPGFEEHWYYTDYQNVRLIGMDTNAPFTVQAQLDWLDAVLADAATIDRIDFVFVQFHHPHKSELWTPGESGFSGQAVARLEQFSSDTGKPSIHFYGHTHGYSRGQSRDHAHLWVNVATGMGNPDYWGEYPQADYEEMQISTPDWGFAIIDVKAGDEPSFRLRRMSRGNEVVPRDNEVTDDITVRRYNTPPDKPVALLPSPASGEVAGFSVELVGSTFTDTDGDSLLESHWQVSETSGDWSNPIIDDWRRIENLYAPANGDSWYSEDNVLDPAIEDVFLKESLPGCRTVYWRVRYRDSGLTWSDWSDEQSFQVGISDGGANAPVPANGATGVSQTPQLEWFPCTPADSYEVYFGTGPVLGPNELVGAQTGTTWSPGLLAAEATYWWRVDFVEGGQTTVGNVWSFTTSKDFPTQGSSEWRFADANPTTGQDLQPAFGTSRLIPLGMTLGSDWSLGTTGGAVPDIAGQQASFIRLDNVSGPNTGLQTWFDAPANGGGGTGDLYHFTLIWDLFLDSSQVDLQALWQGNATNSNDAELFLNCATGGFYVDGYVGSGLWSTGEWNRIVHRVDWGQGTSALFVNGTKVLSDDDIPAPDWMYGQGSGNPTWMLTDDNGGTDVSIVHCANLAIVDALMPDAAIAALGGPKAGGIITDNVTNYCISAGNSAGPGSWMGASGTTSITANDFQLHAGGAVPFRPGLFYYGPDEALVPFGNGFGCVGAGALGIHRLQPPLLTNILGNASRPLDFTAHPANSGLGQINPGSTWSFQFWYRDPDAGGSGFNLSDGLRVTFGP